MDKSTELVNVEEESLRTTSLRKLAKWRPGKAPLKVKSRRFSVEEFHYRDGKHIKSLKMHSTHAHVYSCPVPKSIQRQKLTFVGTFFSTLNAKKSIHIAIEISRDAEKELDTNHTFPAFACSDLCKTLHGLH